MSIEHYNQLHALLPDCTIIWNVPFQNGTVSSDSEELTIAALHAQALSHGIAAVTGGAHALFVGEKLQTDFQHCEPSFL